MPKKDSERRSDAASSRRQRAQTSTKSQRVSKSTINRRQKEILAQVDALIGLSQLIPLPEPSPAIQARLNDWIRAGVDLFGVLLLCGAGRIQLERLNGILGNQGIRLTGAQRRELVELGRNLANALDKHC